MYPLKCKTPTHYVYGCNITLHHLHVSKSLNIHGHIMVSMVSQRQGETFVTLRQNWYPQKVQLKHLNIQFKHFNKETKKEELCFSDSERKQNIWGELEKEQKHVLVWEFN